MIGDCLAKEEKDKKAKDEARRRAAIALIFPREKLWQIDFRFVKPLDVRKRVCVCVCVCVCVMWRASLKSIIEEHIANRGQKH